MSRERRAPLMLRCGRLLASMGLAAIGLPLMARGLRATSAPPTGAMAELARGLLRRGDAEGASTWFAEVDAREPGAPEGALGLARCASAMHRWSPAADAWSALIERFPDDPRAPGWRRNLRRDLERAGRRDELLREREADLATDERLRRYVRVTANSVRPDGHGLRFQHVVIVTYGRSGSTLLQGVLNSIDGVLVRGENGNLFAELQRLARRIEAVRSEHPETHLPIRPWFGASEMTHDVAMGALRAAARALLLADHPDDGSVGCLGFKEIRFGELGDGLEAHLDFLGDLLPGLAYVFNTRDVVATSSSGWWASRDRDEVTSSLRALDRRFAAYGDHRDDCFHIRYEDVVARSERLRALHEFLGAPYEPDRIDAVLAVPHTWAGASAQRRRSRPR